jgi:hypothetical protein
MGVYQFEFAVIPAVGIIRIHGCIVDFIDQFAAHKFDTEVDLDADLLDYWEGVDKLQWQHAIEGWLPSCASWSTEALMYGDSGGDRIEVWDSFIHVALDVRNLNAALLLAIIDTAQAQNCKFVLKDQGHVISPNLDEVVDRLNSSSAMKFLRDPVGFTKQR